MDARLIEFTGWIATVLVLAAFFLNTRRILAPNSILFLSMNAVSGLFMAINSAYHQSYPSATANAIWLLIAISGLVRGRRNARTTLR